MLLVRPSPSFSFDDPDRPSPLNALRPLSAALRVIPTRAISETASRRSSRTSFLATASSAGESRSGSRAQVACAHEQTARTYMDMDMDMDMDT